jgi:hypothetical protein
MILAAASLLASRNSYCNALFKAASDRGRECGAFRYHAPLTSTHLPVVALFVVGVHELSRRLRRWAVSFRLWLITWSFQFL